MSEMSFLGETLELIREADGDVEMVALLVDVPEDWVGWVDLCSFDMKDRYSDVMDSYRESDRKPIASFATQPFHEHEARTWPLFYDALHPAGRLDEEKGIWYSPRREFVWLLEQAEDGGGVIWFDDGSWAERKYASYAGEGVWEHFSQPERP